MKGRILTDVPQTGHKAGEFADIDKDIANALIEIGAFDPDAQWDGDDEPSTKRTRKTKQN